VYPCTQSSVPSEPRTCTLRGQRREVPGSIYYVYDTGARQSIGLNSEEGPGHSSHGAADDATTSRGGPGATYYTCDEADRPPDDEEV